MAYTHSEVTLIRPRIQAYLDRLGAESLKTVEWYVENGRKIREGSLSRRFVDFHRDYYDLG